MDEVSLFALLLRNRGGTGTLRCDVLVSLDFEGGLADSGSDPLFEADRLIGRWCIWNGEGEWQPSTDTSGALTDDVKVVPRSRISGSLSVLAELLGRLSSGVAAGGAGSLPIIISVISSRDRRLINGLSLPRRPPEVT